MAAADVKDTEPVGGPVGMLVGPVIAVAVLADEKQEALLSSQSDLVLDLSLMQV